MMVMRKLFFHRGVYSDMVLSYYLTKPLYSAIWHVLKRFRSKKSFILYCDHPFDCTLFANVQKHLAPVAIVARNKKVASAIRAAGHTCTTLPSFPDVVIMFRNMAWKFPCRKILKFGFEHGAYNFKRFSKAHYYNLFTVFFMTSSHDVERVKKRGVTTAEAVGFPKIDTAFDGTITKTDLQLLSKNLNLDPGKKTILFSATWDSSGMSAVALWYDRLQELASDYNILATVHPWTNERFRQPLENNPSIYFISDHELLRYIMLADCCIGDTNSLIAEFCLLNKPIITFRVQETVRTLPDIIDLLEKVSVRISTFEELPDALRYALTINETLERARRKAVQTFFDVADGNAGRRAAERIISFVSELSC